MPGRGARPAGAHCIEPEARELSYSTPSELHTNQIQSALAHSSLGQAQSCANMSLFPLSIGHRHLPL